jgi:uncharacterized protein YbjT (DUF2867 family)
MPVRVPVRDPARAMTLAEAGAEAAVGDLDVPASSDDAMTGLGRLTYLPAALAGRDRGGPGRRRNPARALAVQRVHAERRAAGSGDS